MARIEDCRIEPDLPEPRYVASSHERVEQYDGALGCAIFVAVALLGYMVVLNANPEHPKPWWAWLLPFGAALWTALAAINHFRDKRGEKALERANQRARDRAFDNAERWTEMTINDYRRASDDLRKIGKTLDGVAYHVGRAEAEYRDSAFSPYWDEIENAVRQLSQFGDEVRALGLSAESYSRSLAGRSHNFPPFPIVLADIPDSTVIADALRRAIRLGHTNYQFAAIWEQRKNREVMIAGFRNVAEAIGGIDRRVESALSDFERRIGDSFALHGRRG